MANGLALFGTPALLGPSYFARVRGIRSGHLVGYWPLWDAAGSAYVENLANVTGEILPNGDFETAGGGGADIFANWAETASDGAIADETVLISSGSHAVKLTAGALINTRVYQQIATIPGETCTLSFWTRGDGAKDGRYKVVNGVDFSNIIGTTQTGVAGTTYTRVEASFTVPAACTSIILSLYCPNTNTNIAYFDDVSIIMTNVNQGTLSGSTQPVLGKPGIGDGRTSMYQAGANACVDLYTIPLAAAFPTVTGTVICWVKPEVAAYTDGAARYALRFKTAQSSPTNAVVLGKQNVDNNLFAQYVDTTVSTTRNMPIADAAAWHCLALAWDATTAYPYLNGAQVGANIIRGVWSGDFDGNRMLFGSDSNNGQTSVWHGWLAHGALWDVTLTAAEIARLARV